MKHVNETAQNKSLEVAIGCVDGSDVDDCVTKIKNKAADLVTLDGGHLYQAGTVATVVQHACNACAVRHITYQNKILINVDPSLQTQNYKGFYEMYVLEASQVTISNQFCRFTFCNGNFMPVNVMYGY